MTSGGPGDHWRTDLISWKLPVFGSAWDSLILEIERLGGAQALGDETEIGGRLLHLWSRRDDVDPKVRKALGRDLRQLRDRLNADATARGWDVDGGNFG